MNTSIMDEIIKETFKSINDDLGGPFGAAVVKDNKIITIGTNLVTSTFDPTAHAEVVAIRRACSELKHFTLEGYSLYTSCEPCPMCLSAIYWAKLDRIYFACTRNDADDIGFSDKEIYDEIPLDYSKRSIPIKQFHRDEAIKLFQYWKEKENKLMY